MFDLFRSRQKTVRYILGGLLMIVALSMVITLIPGYGSTTGSSSDTTTLATVAGQKVTADQIQRSVQQLVRGGRLAGDMVDVYVPQFVDQMIRENAALHEFQSLGLTVTDDEVLTAMMSAYPQFFQNGALVSKDQLEAVLAQQGQTLPDAIEDMRKSLLIRKVQNMLVATTVVTPKELDEELIKKNEKIKIDYIAFPPAKFRDEVKPTAEDIRAYFDAHRNQYTIPEKRAFQVLVVDQAKVEDSLTISDAQLRSAYSANMDNFRMPERVKVRHILVKTTGKSDAEKKQLLAKANDILNQLKKGAKFGDLVKQYSDVVAKMYDGASWVTVGKLNTSTHGWTPSYQGTDMGTASTATTGTSGHTLGFLDGANTYSGVQSFNDGMLGLKGSSSGTGTIKAPAAASSFVWTMPSATTQIVGTGTADTLTNKTFSCASQASCVVRLTADVTGTLQIGNGGTGQTTAAAARGSSGLNVDQFTGHGDSTYTILSTDRTVGTNANFTASRTWTLPAANAVNAGQEIIVADFQGTVTASNTLVIARAGSDTINGTTGVTITAANGAYLLKSDGSSKWTAQAMGAATGGGVTSVTCFGSAITTSGTCATAATKSDQQTGTSTTAVVTPSQAQSHDSAAKAWAYCTNAAGTYTLAASYNISGGTCGKTGPGDLTLTFSTAFASANFACFATVADTFSEIANATPASASTVRVQLFTTNTAAVVNDHFSVVCFGRQ